MTDNNDDNALHDFDLSAWDAPQAPAGIADGVIARLGVTEAAPSTPTATATETGVAIDHRRSRRRLVVAGVATAAVAAAAGWSLFWSMQREPVPATSGSMIAERARHLELDKVSADLDLGADVRWHETPTGLHIEQHAGAATWRVTSGNHVVIDAGNGNGATASIDATGASLRMEIQPMNFTDTRVIGASALTAAAVAMITVVVYEGHVKATSAGQTVVVQPGSTVEVRPNQPPLEPLHLSIALPDPGPQPTEEAASLAINAGESVTIHDPDGAVSVQVLGPCSHDTDVTLTSTHGTMKMNRGLALVQTGHSRYELRCDGSKTVTAAGTIDVLLDAGNWTQAETPKLMKIDADGRIYKIGVNQVTPTLEIHIAEPASKYTLVVELNHVEVARLTANKPTITIDRAKLMQVTYTLAVELDGVRQSKVTTIELEPASLVAPVAVLEQPTQGQMWESPVHISGKTVPGAVVSAVGRGVIVDGDGRFAGDLEIPSGTLAVRIADPQRGIHYYIRRSAAHDVTVHNSCDAEALRKTGSELRAKGQSEAADESFIAAMTCEARGVDFQVAFMTACNKSDAAAARRYYAVLPTESRDTFIGACVRHGITKEQLETPVAPCAADKFRDEGQQAEAEGRHADGLAKFDEAYRCSLDSHIAQLAFMAACSTGVVAKAQHYYAILSADVRNKMAVMCIRNGITKAQLDEAIDAGLPPAPADAGTLHVLSTPVAHILIDGIDTELSTPVTSDQLKLAPGRHKVTFEIDNNRYTYPVTIEAKTTVTVSKDLR